MAPASTKLAVRIGSGEVRERVRECEQEQGTPRAVITIAASATPRRRRPGRTKSRRQQDRLRWKQSAEGHRHEVNNRQK